MARNKAQMDLTEGPILKKLALFALPFLGSSFIQQLYVMIDVMFIGKFLGTEASAAANAGVNLTGFLLNVFTGLGVGVGVACARAYGGKNDSWLSEIIHTVAVLTAESAVILTLIGIAAARPLLQFVNAPDSILDAATTYLRIYFLSILAGICYNIANGILGALGDSTSALKNQFVGGMINIAGDALAIFVLKAGINGVAAASVIAQSISALLTVFKLTRLPEEYRLSFRKLHINRNVIEEVMKVSIPAAVQAGLITFSNMLIQSQINTLGTVSIAAFSVYYQAENFTYYPIAAVGSATVTFIGQNYGAGKLERLRKGFKTAMGLGVGVGLFCSSLELLGRKFVVSLFTSDEEVLTLCCNMCLVILPFYCLYAVIEILSADMRGRGVALPPMLVTFIGMGLLRVVLLYVIAAFSPTALSAVAIYPLSWVITSMVLIITRIILCRKGRMEPAD